MASEYERRAWANLGPALGQAFQGWGQQRARRAEFDASLAQAELARRDAKEARDEGLDIDRERLELDKTRIESEIARAEDDAEYEATQRDLNLRAESALARMGLGKPDPIAAGRIAGKEWTGGIQEAEGGLEKIRAAVAGLAPAMATGAATAEKGTYTDLAEFLKAANIPQDVAGRIITMSGGVEALKPEDVDYNQMKAAFDMSIAYGLDLPAEFQAMPGVVEAITKGKEAYAKAQNDAEKMNAINIATAEARLKWEEWRAKHPGGGGGGGGSADVLKTLLEAFGGGETEEKAAGEYTDEELKDIAGG